MSLKFNNAMTDFEGETPAAVVNALYFDSARGWAADYDTWWAYQTRLLEELHGITLPHHQAPGAHECLLRALVRIGVLDVGHRPPPRPGPASP